MICDIAREPTRTPTLEGNGQVWHAQSQTEECPTHLVFKP